MAPSDPRTSANTHREEKEAKDKKEQYWKVRASRLSVLFVIDSFLLRQLHEQGKTDQAKADLARLTKIRAEREAAQAKRKAEAECTPVSCGPRTAAAYDCFIAKAAEIEAKRKEQMTKHRK